MPSMRSQIDVMNEQLNALKESYDKTRTLSSKTANVAIFTGIALLVVLASMFNLSNKASSPNKRGRQASIKYRHTFSSIGVENSG